VVRVVVRTSPMIPSMPKEKAKPQRSKGRIETLPSGSLRVSLYAGTDPVTKDRMYLRETVPAGPNAEAEAKRILAGFVHEVYERRHPWARHGLQARRVGPGPAGEPAPTSSHSSAREPASNAASSSSDPRPWLREPPGHSGAMESTKMQSALDAVDGALAAVGDEISEHVAGRGTVGSLRQLKTFRASLVAMKDQIMSGTVPPPGQRLASMGRPITDSWPFDSQLGGAILKAEQRYLKL
jgi:hypothetical protein